MELKKTVTHSTDKIIAVPFVKDIIITLGFTAIIVNLIMVIVYVIQLLSGKKILKQWLVITNFLFLLLQIYYFFFY